MRPRFHLIGLIAALIAAHATAGPATAKTFTVTSCTASQVLARPWAPETTAWMRATEFCDRADGMLIRADISNGPRVPGGSAARWKLSVPGALRIRQINALVRVAQGSGWSAGIAANDTGTWLYGGPGCAYTCGSHPFVPMTLDVNSREVSLQMVCGDPYGCTTEVTSAIRDITTTLDDPDPPQLVITGGTLTSGRWINGEANVTFRAADGDSGVRRTEVFVDGLQKVAHHHWCMPIVLPVCEQSIDDSAALSTRLFQGDGTRVVTVRATDYSGNITDRSFRVYADNTAPIAPVGLAHVASDWQSANRFAIRWRNPSQAGAPIVGAYWRVCPADRVDRAACKIGRRDGANLSELSDLSVPAPGRWQLELALVDAAGNSDFANASKLTLGYDDTPPDVAIQLTNPDDPTRLRVFATDTIAPIARGEVELRRAGSRAWRGVATQLTDGGMEAVIDDERLAAGNYDVRARAWNAAGLERSTENWTSGQTAKLTLPLRIATRVRLGAARKSSRRKARAVLVRRPVLAFGRRVRLTGQLTAPGGNPLVGVPVQVSSRIDGPNTAWRPAAELRTDRSGHFRYIVARGPSRLIRFRYAGTPTVRSITQTVPVRVRASSSIKVSRRNVVNGDAIRFRGKIRGGHLPARKRVELQFFARGKWRTFDSARANRRGRWGYSYRFDGSRGTVRWRFRALITPENGYPYTTGRSRTVAVTVRGLP
jgi:hypothetical protein